MSVVTIRPLAGADVVACVRIFDRAWNAGHPYASRSIDLPTFKAETNGEQILVAEISEGMVAGFVTLYAPENFIHHLYVEPRLHGSGIGTALLQAVLDLAGGRASLKCQTRNEGALAFYRRHGWTEAETGEGEYGPWVRMCRA